MSEPKRQVICGDAIAWLRKLPKGKLGSIITSIPDMSDVKGLEQSVSKSEEDYKQIWQELCQLCMEAVKPEGYFICYEVDRKYKGHIVSKAYWAYEVAARIGLNPIWHKVVLRHEINTIDYFRPGFGHIVCFSRKGTSGKPTPDVLPFEPLSWKDGMPHNHCVAACEFVKGTTTTVVDPFCGVGTVLAAANSVGLNAYGIEIVPDLAEYAKRLRVGEIIKSYKPNRYV